MVIVNDYFPVSLALYQRRRTQTKQQQQNPKFNHFRFHLFLIWGLELGPAGVRSMNFLTGALLLSASGGFPRAQGFPEPPQSRAVFPALLDSPLSLPGI